MSTESAVGSPDPIITRMIDDLREEHERGEISCLAVVVVRHNGDATSSLHGAAPPVTLLGSLEMLKGSVLSKEFGDEQCNPRRLTKLEGLATDGSSDVRGSTKCLCGD